MYEISSDKYNNKKLRKIKEEVQKLIIMDLWIINNEF